MTKDKESTVWCNLRSAAPTTLASYSSTVSAALAPAPGFRSGSVYGTALAASSPTFASPAPAAYSIERTGFRSGNETKLVRQKSKYQVSP